VLVHPSRRAKLRGGFSRSILGRGRGGPRTPSWIGVPPSRAPQAALLATGAWPARLFEAHRHKHRQPN